MSNLTVAAIFTKTNGDVAATGLTLAEIDLYLTAHNPSDGTDAVIWNGTQNPTSEIDNVGAYVRVYDSADLGTYNYFASAVYTGATVLDQDTVQGVIDNAGVAVWSYDSRTLTQSATAVTAAVSGSDITIHRGDSLSASITALGDISGRSKLWFTVKDSLADIDANSIIQIELTAGLVYLNAADASARAANGSITVDDEDDGDITIVLDEVETDDLVIQSGLSYDVQMLSTGGDISTLATGNCAITADVTRSIT